MKLPDRLSYSSVKQYEDCSEQWRLLRVEELPDLPGIYHAGGTAVHAMTEAEDWARFGGDKPPATFNDYLDSAIAEQETETGSLKATWKVAGKGKEDEAWWRANGPGMVLSWRNWLNSRPYSIWVTPDGEPAIELEMDPVFGVVSSKQFIDRILVRDDDPTRLVVVDLKSGKPPKDQLQLGSYAEGCQQRGWDVRHGGYFMVRSGILSGEHDLSHVMGTRLQYIYEQAWAGIQAGYFPARPSGLCRDWCPVNKYCHAFPGITDTSHLPYPIEPEGFDAHEPRSGSSTLEEPSAT